MKFEDHQIYIVFQGNIQIVFFTIFWDFDIELPYQKNCGYIFTPNMEMNILQNKIHLNFEKLMEMWTDLNQWLIVHST